MSMKTTVKALIFLTIIFIINIIFYYTNEDYKFFIKKIKNPEKIIYTNKKEITDEYKIENITWIAIVEEKKENKNIKKIEEEVYLWEKYKDIIKIFEKYGLKEIEIKSNLFDITEEYPDYYFEFYSKDLTLYIFPTKSYSELKDILEIVSYELPFFLNEVNNFWNNSFYINLKENIKDSFVRIVINNKNIVFWLKIKNYVYNEVKEILNNKLK